MRTFLVAFDDDNLIPWVKIFRSNEYNDVKDKIIDYVLNNYEFENTPSLLFDDFCEDVAKEGLYIGNIKEFDEY